MKQSVKTSLMEMNFLQRSACVNLLVYHMQDGTNEEFIEFCYCLLFSDSFALSEQSIF